LKANDYFKIELAKSLANVFILYVIASFLVSRGADIEIVWNAAILVAASNFVTVALSWFFYKRR